MRNSNNWYRMTTLPALAAGIAEAAPIEGEHGSNAAALLVLLGVWALVMGIRNLRELRHKRLVPERQPYGTEKSRPEDGDIPVDG